MLKLYCTYIHTVPSSGDQQKVLKEVDFAISLGGDGTLLYTASLFEVQVVGYRAGVQGWGTGLG